MSVHRVAVQMPAYNDADFVGVAVESVLAQRCVPFELIVSDDASSDATPDIVQARFERYQGPHAVRLVRQATNLGPGAHGTDLYERQSDSELVVVASADDLHDPQRVARLVETLDRTGADLVCSNAGLIDQQGSFLRQHLVGRGSGPISIDEIAGEGWCRATLGATFAFRRTLWTGTGGLNNTLVHGGLDLLLPLRAALRGGCYYLNTPLVYWRQHPRQLKRSTTDESVGREVAGESHRALLLGVRIQQLRELSADRRPWIRQKIPDLRIRALTEAGAWVGHRKRNQSAGFKEEWVGVHDLLVGRRRTVQEPSIAECTAAAERVVEAFDLFLSRPGESALVVDAWKKLVRFCTLRVALMRRHLRPVWSPVS